MKKSDLKSGMIIQTTHNRYGVIELEENRIDICYDPDSLDKYKVLEKISLNNVFEYGNKQLGIGFILDQDTKSKLPEYFSGYNLGDVVIAYEIVSVFCLSKIYDNGEDIYPPIKLR